MLVMFSGPALALALLAITASAAPAGRPELTWTQLPALPDREGFASMFAGVTGDALLAAGGANFPGPKPWEGGSKAWYDDVFVLEKPGGPWRVAGKLPRPLGYGVSATHRGGVVCAGGSDAARHYADCFRLEWRAGQLKTFPLPPLPRPVANASGALLDNTLYVAGGIERPDAANALKTFYSLDLAAPMPVWRELEPWPGPARMLAVAAAQDGAFFLVSGADLRPDPVGKPVRTYLQDAYRFTPGQGWKRIADLPRPAVAAPSPAPTAAAGGFLILSGDDAEQLSTPPTEHKGFPKTALRYDTQTDRWQAAPEVAAPRVTVPTVQWNGGWVVISGERRPGVRSPEVWSLR